MNISCFCLFNELDLLRLRMEYEYPFFDKIVIVEATKTHAGRDKLLYFEEYRSRFERFLDKIVYVIVDDMPEVEKIANLGWRNLVATEYRWHLEEHQRSCIFRGLNELHLADEDWVLVSDLDEFVDPQRFLEATNRRQHDTLHYFMLADYRYTVQSPPVSESWLGGFAATWHTLQRGDPSLLRCAHGELMNYMQWDTPITNLKIIRRRWLHYLHSRRSKGETQGIPTKEIIRKQRGEMSVCEALADAGVTRGRVHRNGGCHFSFMSGGYEGWQKLKLQNFAHAECEGNDPLEDTTMDHYSILRDFIDKSVEEGQYDWHDLDPGLPDFFRHRIKDYPVLLQPRRIAE